jgi:hypothetical protein
MQAATLLICCLLTPHLALSSQLTIISENNSWLSCTLAATTLVGHLALLLDQYN